MPAVIATGGLVGLQGRINGDLATHLGSAMEAAAISFVTGLVLVVIAAALRPARLRRLRTQPIRWWWWLGGLGGAFVVVTTSHAVPLVGVALVTVCLVAGTAAGALGVDVAGLGPSGRHDITALRAAGAALSVAAVAIGAIGTHGGSFRPGLFAVLVVAGGAVALQQAANGQLRLAVEDTWLASLVSFTGGTIALVVGCFAVGAIHPGRWPGTWWLYLGGPLGVVFIAVGAATVQRLGVLRFALATVAGQLLAGVVLDAAWPEPGTQLRVATVIGAVLTLIGVWVSGLTVRDRGTAPGPQPDPLPLRGHR